MEWNDHTFVICAYKESQYLEECSRSLKRQKLKSNILMVTSTMNQFIRSLAEKYEIELIENPAPSSIYGDWNFGVSQVKTKYFTIANQDDLYKPTYAEEARNAFLQAKHPIIFFSDYAELRNGKEVTNSTLLKVKKLLLAPLRIHGVQNSKWIRRRILSLGNPICCPAVSYCRDSLHSFLFSNEFKCDLDWDAWERLSKRNGAFLYCHKVLMCHRIHEESTTTELIENSVRYKEDLEMYKRFWPDWMASFLMKYYSKSQDSNQI